MWQLDVEVSHLKEVFSN